MSIDNTSPIKGISWEEYNLFKRWLPAYNPNNNSERLKWITYINKSRQTSDGTTTIGNPNSAGASFNTSNVENAYNKVSGFAADTGSTDSYIARSLYNLRHINSLEAITAKTAIGVDGFFAETTDRVGSTVTGVLGAIDDAASYVLDELDQISASIKKSTAEYKSRRAADERNNSPDKDQKGNTPTKNILSSAGSSFNKGWSKLNSKMKQNRFANIPGDMFNSARTLLYVVREELEQAIDAINQIFSNIEAAIIKLSRKLRSIIKALITILMSALDWLLEASGIQAYIDDFLQGVGSFLVDIGDNLKETVNILLGAKDGEDVMINLFSDFNKEIEEIVQKGIFTYAWESLGANITIQTIPGLNKLSDIQRSVQAPLYETLNALRRYSDINYLISLLNKDTQKTLGVIQAFSTNAKGFIGNGIRSAFIKNVMKGRTSFFAGAKKGAGIQFTFAQSYHFGANQFQYNPASSPIFMLPRLAIDNSPLQVDRAGNKLNYSAYTNSRLF